MVGNLAGARIAIYARFSSDKQSDASIEDQVHRAREYVRQHSGNAEAAFVFTDYAVSGASMDRPGMRALEQAVKRRDLDVLVTESVDRLSRHAAGALGFADTLAHHGVMLICLDGTLFGAGGKTDALMYGIRALFAQQYRTDLADKTRRGLEGRARVGAPTGAVGYGYRIVTADSGIKSIVVEPDKAATVRRIFAQYAAGDSFATIASKLNADGIPPPRSHGRSSGAGWMASAVRAMLLNERYIGQWGFGLREWIKAPGSNVRRPQVRKTGPLVQEERPDLVIVSPEVWAAVQARFARNPSMGPAKRSFMLSGILHCQPCSGPMHYAGGGHEPYFACRSAKKGGSCDNRRHIRIGIVEDRVIHVIRSHLAEAVNHIIEVITEETRIWAENRPSRTKELQRELTDLDRKIGTAVNLLIDTPVPELKERIRAFEARRSLVRLELASLADEADAIPTVDAFLDRVRALEALRTAPPNAAREVLRPLLEEGRVYCEPHPDRSFTLRWGVLPGMLLDPERRTPPEAFSQGRHRWGLLHERPMVAGARSAGSPTEIVPWHTQIAL